MDAVRASMAFLVLFCHMKRPEVVERFIDGFRFQHDAVIVFFVLSGYFIKYAVEHKDNDAKRYFLSRASRILSVSVPAIFLGVAAQMLGGYIFDDWPKVDNGYLFVWVNSSLLFTNQLWNANYQLYTQEPYWSLVFEVWFYVIFGIFTFLSGSRRVMALAISFLIVGPKVLILMPIWILGCFVYSLHARIKISRISAVFCFSLSFILYFLAKITFGKEPYFDYPALGAFLAIPLWTNFGIRMDFAISFVWDYFVGFLAAIMIFSGYYVFEKIKFSRIPSVCIRYLAGISFSIYLYQYPALRYLNSIDQSGVPGIIFYSFKFFAAVAVCILLYQFTEKQKPLLSSFLEKIFYKERVSMDRGGSS